MVTARLAAILVAASPLFACAQDQSVAQLTHIVGNVLVSNGSRMASAAGSVRLSPDMRILPTFNASAEVVFDDGCRVKVGPGERYVVDREPPCVKSSGPASHPTEAKR